jgi:hypothetical protein
LGAEDAVAVVDQRIAEIQAMYDEINAETGEGTDELVEDTQTDDAADSAE